jgi:hypothetical protein
MALTCVMVLVMAVGAWCTRTNTVITLEVSVCTWNKGVWDAGGCIDVDR